jgi:hypothetical protein
MQLWPRHELEFDTPSAPNDVLDTVRRWVRPVPGWFDRPEPGLLHYCGEVFVDGFRLSPSGSQNVPLIIVGKVAPLGNGSRVRVVFRPARLVEGFLWVCTRRVLPSMVSGTGWPCSTGNALQSCSTDRRCCG